MLPMINIDLQDATEGLSFCLCLRQDDWVSHSTRNVCLGFVGMFDGDFCHYNAIVFLFLNVAHATRCSDKPVVIMSEVNIKKVNS